ncbi:hypothetical protein [Achromobacter spanius]|uniref:hypothetical protein n=1 Tax=Achromobacter spanius TaxID=217203 RepID=UPI000D8CD6BD|nr:hypothetical protein [Achromobacter spanius]SPT37211.1 Uncharacterised protein [Achromobacter denitrificans]
MHNEQLAELILKSVASGERIEDFSWMVNTLIGLERKPRIVRVRNGRRFRTASEQGGATPTHRAWLICLLNKPKPPEYIVAIHEFRLALAGVADDERLQEVFLASIRDRLLLAPPIQSLRLLRPSMYFDMPRALKKAEQLGVNLSLPPAWY